MIDKENSRVQEAFEKARQRLQKEVPNQFVITDLIQFLVEESILSGHLPSQDEICATAGSCALLLNIELNSYGNFSSFYPSKLVLEENRVYHGDCRDILPLLKMNKPKGIITDYPYGVDFQSNKRKATAKFNKILNDDKPFLDKWIRQSYQILGDIGFLLTFYQWNLQDELFDELQSAGFEIKNQLIWLKGGYCLGDLTGSFATLHETAVFAVKGRYEFPKHAGRPQNILNSLKAGSQVIHPNEKPQLMMQSLVRDLTEKGDLIIDPFSGSGAVCAAAVAEGRRAIGIELDGRHVPHIGCSYPEYGNKRIIENSKKSNSLF